VVALGCHVGGARHRSASRVTRAVRLERSTTAPANCGLGVLVLTCSAMSQPNFVSLIRVSPGGSWCVARARRVMASYERRHAVPTASAQGRTEPALRRLLLLLGDGDVRGIERMLAEDVRAVAGVGAFTALSHPIIGAGRVAQLFARRAASRRERPHITIRSISGFPVAQLEFESTLGRRPHVSC